MRTREKEKSMDAYWDERAHSYSGMNRDQFYGDKRGAWEEIIFSHVDESRPLEVMDIGTGPGFFAILASLRGHRVTAVDMNGKMLCHAQENAAAAGVDVEFVQVGHTLPFEKKRFDLILSRDVTWTLTEPEGQLESWAELLRPGGKMLYFDAEWYFHLKDRAAFEKWRKIKGGIEKAGIVFYPKGGEMEKIAVDLPMTYKDRPAWDKAFWTDLGYRCAVYKDLNRYIFDREEQIRYQAHPVFLVEVARDIVDNLLRSEIKE